MRNKFTLTKKEVMTASHVTSNIRPAVYLSNFIRSGIIHLFQKRYQDGKFSLLLLTVSLPIQTLAGGGLAYEYFYTGEVSLVGSPNSPAEKYAGGLFFSPALLFLWPFALWYFPYLSGGGKLAMTLFSLAVYRLTAGCSQILYRWYLGQEQLRELQTEAANQLGYINNTIADGYGLVYIKFKETGPILQHNAEYLIQQQLNKLQLSNWSDLAQKHGQAAADHFQDKLEEIKIFSIQLLKNRQVDDLDPTKTISLLLEKKIQAELPLTETGSELNTPGWQKIGEKIQGIDGSHPHLQTCLGAVGGLVALGITYWGVHSLVGYFFGPDKRIESLAGIVTNQEKDVTELLTYLQTANACQKQEILALIQGLQDTQKLSRETASQLLNLQNNWLQPPVQNLINRSAELLHLAEVIDPGDLGLICSAVQELKSAVARTLILQERERTALLTLSDHFYQLCNRLNMHIASELRPDR